MREKIERRFRDGYRVDRKSGCWVWVKSKDTYGYGQMWGRALAPFRQAHKWGYFLHIGPIPEGMHVLHRCDNPSCVNPDHLFIGTAKDNMHDMVAKRRHHLQNGVPEDATRRAKLTKEQVLEIRSDERPWPEVAATYAVSRNTVRNIKMGYRWKWL